MAGERILGVSIPAEHRQGEPLSLNYAGTHKGYNLAKSSNTDQFKPLNSTRGGFIISERAWSIRLGRCWRIESQTHTSVRAP